jgi:hypothetical protein
MLPESVSEHDVAAVIQRHTGIPLRRLLMGERDRLLHMEGELAKRVVGQDQAIEVISNSVRVSRAGLHPHNKPIGVFLFLGPSGVGKTELCKALAEFMFDDPAAIARVDMSEVRPSRQQRWRRGVALSCPPRRVRSSWSASPCRGWWARRQATLATTRAVPSRVCARSRAGGLALMGRLSQSTCAGGRTKWCCSTRSKRRAPAPRCAAPSVRRVQMLTVACRHTATYRTYCCRCSMRATSPTDRCECGSGVGSGGGGV